MLSSHALVLNADYSPKEVVPWRRALSLLLRGVADLVEGYPAMLHSAETARPVPAVVRLRRYVDLYGKVRFSRRNILARDAYQCGYCGARPRKGIKPDLGGLTIDHVVPRARAVAGRVVLSSGASVPVTSWRNVLTACWPCNSRKGSRTPAEAGMPMRSRPKVPSAWDVLRMSLISTPIPAEWKQYLPSDSGWRGYWDEELED